MSVTVVGGDATKPHCGKGKKVICHVCNDLGGWGRGFVMELKKTFPKAELDKQYRKWHRDRKGDRKHSTECHSFDVLSQETVKELANDDPAAAKNTTLTLESTDCCLAASEAGDLLSVALANDSAGGYSKPLAPKEDAASHLDADTRDVVQRPDECLLKFSYYDGKTSKTAEENRARHEITAMPLESQSELELTPALTATPPEKGTEVVQDLAPPFRLGEVQFLPATDLIWVANMLAQRGIKSQGDKIDYGALSKALDTVGRFARERGASVHMPRIGCGLAGSHWAQIEPIIRVRLAEAHGVDVWVYEKN